MNPPAKGDNSLKQENDEMTRHEMRLDAGPFLKIKSGQKNVELRLYDEKRRQIKPGDEISFTNIDNGDQILTRAIGLCRFMDFASLIQAMGWKECGWEIAEASEQYNKKMEKFYTSEEIQKYGALGIVLELIKWQ